MSLLAQNAQRVLNQALASPYGVLVRIHSQADKIQPSIRGRQILYRFKNLSPDYANIRIDVMSDTDIWVIKLEGTKEEDL